MNKFRSILVVSDGECSDADTFIQALSLVRNTGAAIAAFIACPALPRRLRDYTEAYEASRKQLLNESLAAARASLGIEESAIPVRVDIEGGDRPGERVVRRVLRGEHDLVLKAADSAGEGRGLRAIDMDLLKKCPCPVWLSRPIARHRNEIRVAVAVDPKSEERAGHDLSIKLLTLARSLADMCSGGLIIVSCWEFEFESYLLHNPWHRVPEAEVQRIVASEEAERRDALNAIVGESGIGGDISIRHVRGQPDRAIPAVVDEEGIDILVMGTVARTGVPGLIMGNTAENVVRQLGCSLVAVKPPGFASPVKAY